MAVPCAVPSDWIRYDVLELVTELIEAKAAIQSLSAIPFQRSWADSLQAMELKREVAGTSRIEGAEFTERELDEALSAATPEDQLTRSQRQARAATSAYRWIERLPPDRPIDEDLIRDVHRRIVTGCDDDHCAPGQLRSAGENVVFGRPLHRGAEGGRQCQAAFRQLCDALRQQFRGHDPLIQALALHYHLGAMHPFQDGNGRTARAMEALLLRRAQLKDTLFIAMSNYYYDEKNVYLTTLTLVRATDFDLTPFLRFGLRGIATQCQRLLREIRAHVQKSLFRDVMGKMYGRLLSTKKRALARRQCEILDRLLNTTEVEHLQLYAEVERHYQSLKAPLKAYIRDLNDLVRLSAVHIRPDGDTYCVAARLSWATEITETEFYRQINELRLAKSTLMLSP